MSNKRGLASASPETRNRVASSGGKAEHEKRGLQATDEETRTRVAVMGGLARGKQRRERKKNVA
ncbi:MAG: hypothetical protein KGN01_07530 [Patescibacteria group bacterium]|nr:hypothetical protein [Patescibacteria group bacterium]